MQSGLSSSTQTKSRALTAPRSSQKLGATFLCLRGAVLQYHNPRQPLLLCTSVAVRHRALSAALKQSSASANFPRRQSNNRR